MARTHAFTSFSLGGRRMANLDDHQLQGRPQQTPSNSGLLIEDPSMTLSNGYGSFQTYLAQILKDIISSIDVDRRTVRSHE